MNGQTKYIVFGALMVLFVIIGSLLFASAIENDDGGDTFGRVFVGALGASLLVSGIRWSHSGNRDLPREERLTCPLGVSTGVSPAESHPSVGVESGHPQVHHKVGEHHGDEPQHQDDGRPLPRPAPQAAGMQVGGVDQPGHQG